MSAGKSKSLLIVESTNAHNGSVSELALRMLFDADFYLANNRDVKKSKLDPFLHFLEHGAKEGRSPHPLFDSSYYFDMAPDPQAIGDNPVLHFLNIGHRLGFNPHPLFDLAYYRQQAGALLGEENPLLHFLVYGKELQLNPHPLFNTQFYLDNYGDARQSKLNPLLHFLRYGKAKQPHPFFDTRFYLSKYADIRKSSMNPLVHFVWRGARERRWPNAKFDTVHYLRTILPASFDNPLLHYVGTGQKQHLLTIATDRDDTSGTLLLQTVLRFFCFALLCLLHAFRRANISNTVNYDHQFSAFKFWRLSMSRFWQGCGSQIAFTRPTYLIQPKRMAPAQSYPSAIYKSPLTFVYLHLANVFKVQGFFADAESILRSLSKEKNGQQFALCSLGDLILIQASWAYEFEQYEKAGIALNPALESSALTWHKQSFAEALDIFEQAISIDCNNTDAQWLLSYGYLMAGKYSKALNVIDKYSGKQSEAAGNNLLKAKAVFGLDPNRGAAVRRQFLGDWSNECNIAALRQVSIADLPEDVMHEHLCVVKPVQMPIESSVVRDCETISFKNTLEFVASYLSRFKSAQIIPEHGMIVVDDQILVKESAHIKPCHIPVFSSYIQAVNDESAFLCAPKPVLFKEENCIYIGGNNNFYHWLLDELPRLSLIEQTSLFNTMPILIDRNASPWQYALLSMLGIEQDRLRPVDLDRPTSFRNLIVPSRLSGNMVAHPAAVSYMRKKLLTGCDIAKPTAGKRLYLTRNLGAKTERSILNERNIIDKFKRNNFQIVDTGNLSIKEQIELFHDAEIIAGPGGAGLTNILFAPKGARLLSLSSGNVLCETFTSIAAAIGQESWWVTGPSYARPYPHWIWTTFDYEIAEKDIDYCFERIL